ncbi:histidine phosphatase family protein [Parathermosynechococcus lividus]
MGLTLYFLRHGQTSFSRANAFCGELDPPLTEAGTAMAAAFASAYAELPWQAVFASPMVRTRATAQFLCDRLGLEMQLRDGLREIYYGQWEGLSTQEVNERFHDDYVSWLSDPGWNAPTGGERGIDIYYRSNAVLLEIERQYPSGNILIVSHKATIRIMLCGLLGIDVGRFRDRIAAPVASVSIVEYTARGPLLLALAERSHLPAHLRELPGT